MKFFIRIFMFLIVIGAAAYGYAWYKNKQAVDQIITPAGGSYDSTYIDVNGDSIINGIRFPMPGTSQTASIESIRMGTGSLMSNVKLAKAFGSKDFNSLPQHFDLVFDVKGAKLPLDLSMDTTSSNSNDVFFNKAAFAGCGDRTDLSVADLSALKIYALSTDSKMKFTVDRQSNKAYADLYLDFDQLNTTKLKFSLDNFSFNNPFGVNLSSGSLEVSDNGIQRDIASLCAKESGLSEKQFTQRHISYLKHLLYNENIFLSPEFYAEYSQYHGNPRTIKATFHPDKSLQPMSLMGVSARRLISLLNADIKINDKSITPLFGNRPDPSELPQLDEVTIERSTLRTVQGLTVQATSVSNIARYAGYDAYFNYRGKKYKGQIISVSNGNAIIRYEFNAGNRIAKPFALSDITKLRVRREYAPSKEADKG